MFNFVFVDLVELLELFFIDWKLTGLNLERDSLLRAKAHFRGGKNELLLEISYSLNLKDFQKFIYKGSGGEAVPKEL